MKEIEVIAREWIIVINSERSIRERVIAATIVVETITNDLVRLYEGTPLDTLHANLKYLKDKSYNVAKLAYYKDHSTNNFLHKLKNRRNPSVHAENGPSSNQDRPSDNNFNSPDSWVADDEKNLYQMIVDYIENHTSYNIGAKLENFDHGKQMELSNKLQSIIDKIREDSSDVVSKSKNLTNRRILTYSIALGLLLGGWFLLAKVRQNQSTLPNGDVDKIEVIGENEFRNQTEFQKDSVMKLKSQTENNLSPIADDKIHDNRRMPGASTHYEDTDSGESNPTLNEEKTKFNNVRGNQIIIGPGSEIEHSTIIGGDLMKDTKDSSK
jgi:hypothetical protein